MNRFLFGLFVTSAVLLFLFNGPLLDMVGWRYSLEDGPFITKIHPATYLSFVGAVVAFIAAPYRVLRFVATPSFLVYAFAVLLVCIKGALITMSGVTGGEMSMAIVGFLMPALLLISVQPLSEEQLSWLAPAMRVFFVIDSLMALAERAVGHRFVPSFLDRTMDARATGLLGHPLSGALLTGLMIIFLVTARRGRASVASRLPEIALHAAAMFAFGGRSALVFTPAVLILSAVLGRSARNQARLTTMQRVLPFVVVLIGLALIFMPFQFVDQTLDRFTQDYGSSQTRDSAVTAFLSLPPSDMMNGMNFYDRLALAKFYGSVAGFELTWVSLAVTYGLLVTLPLAVGLPWLLFRLSRSLDRSAFYMVIQFLVVTAGSIGLGVKSLLMSQLIVLMLVLCQPRLIGAAPPRRGGRTLFAFDELGAAGGGDDREPPGRTGRTA